MKLRTHASHRRAGAFTRVSQPKAAIPAFVPPYPPSWVDRLTDWVDRLPGPPWLWYALLGAGSAAVLVIAAWAGGGYHPGRAFAFHIWVGGQLSYMLGLIHYLDQSAGRALDSFRPALKDTVLPKQTAEGVSSKFADLRYRLTTLPPLATWVATLLGVAFGLLLPILFLASHASEPEAMAAAFGQFGFPATTVFFRVLQFHFTLTEAVSGVLVFHTIHQLRQISRVYGQHTDVNLYRLQPLYALSVPAGLTSAGLVLYTYAWFGTAPTLLAEPVSRILAVFFTAIAAATFAWPLLGIHQRLVAEKKRLLGASTQRFETTVSELHRRVDRRALASMDNLNKTLNCLEIEQAALRRVPTWPWEPGALRGVVAALLLPILIWLIQFALQRWLG